MSDTESTEDEETIAEGEKEHDLDLTDMTSFKTSLKNLAISAARQFFCCCNVLIFPVGSMIFATLPVDTPKIHKILYPEGGTDQLSTDHYNLVEYAHHYTLSYIVGNVLAVLSLHWIGRKYTVVIGNFLQLAGLSYSWKINAEKSQPYQLTLIYHGVNDFCKVTYFIYVAEVASTTFRVFFMGLYFFIKEFCHHAMRAGIKHRMNPMVLYCTVITSLSLLFALIVPETPFGLALKGKPEKAEEKLAWLRAGYPHTVEFNQLLARAQNIIENQGIMRNIFSRTFLVGLIFSSFIVIINFPPCEVLEAFIYNFHYAAYLEGTVVFEHIVLLLSAADGLETRHHTYGSLIFMWFSLVVPRKIMYFLSYALGAFIIVMIWLRMGPINLLLELASYCHLTQYLGVWQLSTILPVEIYPAPLRAVGVATTAILMRVYQYFFLRSSVLSAASFPTPWVTLTLSYINFFGSFMGIIFILLFMPETWKMNIYQLKKLDIHSPIAPKKRLVAVRKRGEGGVVAGEGTEVPGEVTEVPEVEGEGTESESSTTVEPSGENQI